MPRSAFLQAMDIVASHIEIKELTDTDGNRWVRVLVYPTNEKTRAHRFLLNDPNYVPGLDFELDVVRAVVAMQKQEAAAIKRRNPGARVKAKETAG